MKTLDEVIKAFEWCLSDDDADCSQCPYYTGKDTDCHDRNTDALHYLEAYRRLSQGLVSENTEIRPEGIYCKVCGTRLDKDWDDENLG